MQSHDPYFKLRTQPATPDDEVCQCPGSKPVKLMYALTENPIHCIDCNLEVAPDVLAPDSHLVEDVVAWRDAYAVIYRLWLDSGTHETRRAAAHTGAAAVVLDEWHDLLTRPPR